MGMALSVEANRARVRDWRVANPDKERVRNSAWYASRRVACLKHYSNGALACSCCGEGIYEFLTIDHIDGKKSMGHTPGFGGMVLYSWLFNNNFPPGFDVLCMNCNLAKGLHGQCPHKKFSVFGLSNVVEGQ